jgi:transposase
MTSLTGIPLAVTLSAANLHDLRQLLPLVFLEFPPIGGKPGRPLDRPRSVTTDKGYDCQTTRDLLASVGIDTHIPKRGTDDTNHLGRIRWPIERTLSWLKQFRRLRIRWERLSHLHEAFLTLGCSLIAWRYLTGQ